MWVDRPLPLQLVTDVQYHVLHMVLPAVPQTNRDVVFNGESYLVVGFANELKIAVVMESMHKTSQTDK